MITPSELTASNNTYALNIGSVINIYVNGGNTVGGRFNSTPQNTANNQQLISIAAGSYTVISNSNIIKYSSFATLPIQIWNDSNTETRRSWVYMRGPYSNNNSLTFETFNRLLYPTQLAYDPDRTAYYYHNLNAYTTSVGSKSVYANLYDNTSNFSIYVAAPSNEIFLNILNGTRSPIDVRAPVTYNSIPGANTIPDTPITGSLDITINNSNLLLGTPASIVPSPNNYTRQVDFTVESTSTYATIIPRKTQTWIVG